MPGTWPGVAVGYGHSLRQSDSTGQALPLNPRWNQFPTGVGGVFHPHWSM